MDNQNKEKNFISAVVYVHNCGRQIGEFLSKLIYILECNFENSEIICVNDYSLDDSVDIIREVSHKAMHTSVSIIHMSYFHGLERSMNAGGGLAIGDYVFEFDVPALNFDPSVVLEIYNKALEGYDIVSACAKNNERFFSGLFYAIMNRDLEFGYKLHTENFRILSRRAINRTGAMTRQTPYRKAAYYTSGLKIFSIRYNVTGELPGNIFNKYDKQERIFRKNLAVDSLILYTKIAYRLTRAMTYVMAVLMVMVMAYSFIIYMTGKPVEGWTSTILFLSVSFGALFFILSFVVKYLDIILELVFKKEQYSYESIEKLTR